MDQTRVAVASPAKIPFRISPLILFSTLLAATCALRAESGLRDTDFQSGGASVAVHAAHRGKPWINLTDGYALPAGPAVDLQTRGVVDYGTLRPLAMAAADFDEDGVPDLICSYSAPIGGLLSLYRGNVDAIYPDTAEAWQRKQAGTFSDSPFLSPAALFNALSVPVFLGVGDFDADGHVDVALSDGKTPILHWLRGNGRGGFGEASAIELPGVVTALIAGEVNGLDGLADLVLGTNGPAGPKVLIFQSSKGALKTAPQGLGLGSPVTGLGLGQLDHGAPFDLVIAANHELITVAGRDSVIAPGEKSQEVPLERVSRRSFSLAIRSVAVGDFIWDPTHQTDVAVLLDDGRVQLLQSAGPEAKTLSGPTGRTSQLSAPWEVQSEYSISTAVGTPIQESWPLLVAARVSGLPVDDLVVVDPGSRAVQLLIGDAEGWKQHQPDAHVPSATVRQLPVRLDVEGQPVAVLPMRLNTDALSDLVILKAGPAAVTVTGTVASTTFLVNTDGTAMDASSSDGVCDTDLIASGLQCTLHAAVEQANATPGADLIQFAIAHVSSDALPEISGPVTIDGAQGAGTRTELSWGPSHAGLFIIAGNSAVRNLVINSQPGVPIMAPWIVLGVGLHTNGNNIVEANYIGTDSQGKSIRRLWEGVFASKSPNNMIGGTAPAARNVISGTQWGVIVAGVVSNRIVANFIGTDASGLLSLCTGIAGVQVGPDLDNAGQQVHSYNNTIENNVIGGGAAKVEGFPEPRGFGMGIIFWGDGTLMQGNRIGVGADGKAAIPNYAGIRGGNSPVELASPNRILSNTISSNSAYGIAAFMSSQPAPSEYWIENNTIRGNGEFGLATGGVGSKVSLVSNTISSHTVAGVWVAGTDRCLISRNSIFANTGLNIDLSDAYPLDGVTLNDAGDADTGPNDLQNYPVLDLVSGGTKVTGVLFSTPNSTFDIEFFENDNCHPSCHGGGQLFLASIRVTTDAQGSVSFEGPFAPIPGKVYTATATLIPADPKIARVTSEFSACAPASNPGVLRGVKFEDKNGNGVKDDDDLGIPDWTIELTGTGRTTKTDAQGRYKFEVCAGTYEITEEMPEGEGDEWIQTYPPSVKHKVTPKSGETVENLDFGNFKKGKIKGVKFNDRDGNGLKGTNEELLPGWTIELNEGEKSKITDEKGSYEFPDLGPGKYRVREALKPSWVQTTASPAEIELKSGQEVNVNFGNRQPGVDEPYGKITGIKFNDRNASGAKDGDDELGLSGWRIELDGGVDWRITNDQGGFEFRDLPPGTYVVNEVREPGWEAVAPVSQTVEVTAGKETVVVFANRQEGPASCTCTPATATNKLKTNHTVTVHVKRFSQSAANVALRLRVTKGPNEGMEMTAVTNADGQATFTYSSERGGTDYLRVDGEIGSAAFTCGATKTWSGGILLLPRLGLGLGFCKDKPLPVKVIDEVTGADITGDPNVEFEWIRPGGVEEAVANWVLGQLKKVDSRIDAKIVGISVNRNPAAGTAEVVFKEAGVNMLEARRKMSDGTIIKSNRSFLIGGMEIMKVTGLKIEPVSFSNLLV
ncbi:MAG: hypothetical protein EHM61_24445, partial [Acidobacteria bacterium]